MQFAIEVAFQEHRAHPIAPVAGPKLNRRHGIRAARYPGNLVEQNSVGGIFEGQQEAGDIPQRGTLDSSLAQGTIGAAAKTDEDKILAGVENLFQAQVVVQADARGWNSALVNWPEETPDLLLLVDQLSRIVLSRGRQAGQLLPQKLHSLRGEAKHAVIEGLAGVIGERLGREQRIDFVGAERQMQLRGTPAEQLRRIRVGADQFVY